MSSSAPPPVRFELDKRSFGLVQFPRQKGRVRIQLEPLQTALKSCLGVTFEERRERLFGPKVQSFTFMGERVKIRILENGNAAIDLGSIDDEVRETLLEQLRQSYDFEAL